MEMDMYEQMSFLPIIWEFSRSKDRGMFSSHGPSKYHHLTRQFKNIKIPFQHKCIKIYLLSFTKFHFGGIKKILFPQCWGISPIQPRLLPEIHSALSLCIGPRISTEVTFIHTFFQWLSSVISISLRSELSRLKPVSFCTCPGIRSVTEQALTTSRLFLQDGNPA